MNCQMKHIISGVGGRYFNSWTSEVNNFRFKYIILLRWTDFKTISINQKETD